MSVLNDLKSSVFGNIPKAVLCVKKIKETDKLSPDSLKSIEAGMKNIARKMSTVTGGKAGDSGYFKLQVQYNPSSISFYSQAGEHTMQGPGEIGFSQQIQICLPAQTTMQVELIFDAVNLEDAFMAEKLRLSAGDALAAGIAVYKTAKKQYYSVQTQVDGILALVTQVLTRQVVFNWSTMSFYGELTGVAAKYTMFSPSGRPIRASVTLSIRSGGTAEDGSANVNFSDEEFDRIFGKAGVDMKIDAKSNMQKLSNLTNINF